MLRTMGIAVSKRAGLAGVEQNDAPSGLDAIGDPVLQTLLADRPARQRRRICPALIVPRQQIEAAVVGKCFGREAVSAHAHGEAVGISQVEQKMTYVVYLVGFAGTGKLTIATELALRIDARVVDNQWVNNPIFGLVQTDGVTPLLCARSLIRNHDRCHFPVAQ